MERHGETRWVYTKYWIFATFTRAIRPGMFLLSSNAVDTLFAYDPRQQILVIVALNTSLAGQHSELDLSAVFGSIDQEYQLCFTSFDGSALLKDLGSHPTDAQLRRISLWLPAESVVTLRLPAWGFPPCPLEIPVHIVAAHCGKVAHVHGEEDADGARVTLWEPSAAKHLLWRIVRAPTGRGFRIVSCLSDRAWRCPKTCTSGTPIVTDEIKTDGHESEFEVHFKPAAKHGFWHIVFASNGRNAHVLREACTSGAPVATWSREDRPHHWWKFQPLG